MRGESQATSIRSWPLVSRQSWSSWITEARGRRHALRTERLETIARLEAEQRRAQRSGEYLPAVIQGRPWC